MKLAIVGYGKMGQMIERFAPEHGFTIHARINNAGELQHADGADVAVDFTNANAVSSNVETLAAMKIPLVVGTTGWLAEMEQVRATVKRHQSGLVWSANFSIGVNIFARLVEESARLMAARDEYGAWAWEIHHAAKKDSPSGTLLKLVNAMGKAGYTYPINQASSRVGYVPGTHEIGFDSAADTITLRHTARSREGFATGALKAAQWIIGKKGFHEFTEVIFT